MAAVTMGDPGLGSTLHGMTREQQYIMAQPGITTSELYSFRGRDSGQPGYPNTAPIAYVYWTGATSTTAYSGALTYGGPVVDIVYRRLH